MGTAHACVAQQLDSPRTFCSLQLAVDSGYRKMDCFYLGFFILRGTVSEKDMEVGIEIDSYTVRHQKSLLDRQR